MISPRSFMYSNRPVRQQSASPSSSSNLRSSPSTTAQAAPSRYTCSAQPPSAASQRFPRPKHDESKPGYAVTVLPVPSRPIYPSAATDDDNKFDANMAKCNERRETTSLSPSSPPSATTTGLTRPITPTSPVQIPQHANRDTTRFQKRHAGHRRRPRTTEHHDPDSLSPSLAALLAITDIPRPRPRPHQSRRSRSDKSLPVDDVDGRQSVSEKKLSWSLSRSLSRNSMDMLLSPPDDLGDDDVVSVSDSNIGSVRSRRTISAESVSSLGDSFLTDGISSIETPGSPSPSSQRRRSGPVRKLREPMRSLPDAADAHPLEQPPTPSEEDFRELDYTSLQLPTDEQAAGAQLPQPLKPLKLVFKSNLTASLRALRSAARSFSSINFSSIPPNDLLTRSLLTIDPNVPYTDERRPPVTEEMPSAELRRYLNPTASARIESPPSAMPPTGPFSASIQMQTYKVHRSPFAASPPSRSSTTLPSSTTTPPSQQHHQQHQPQPQSPSQTAFSYPPGMRQREMRENPDFIRIAVMEMAMRRRGKLDDQRPGRARWALPPRKMAVVKVYGVGADGVPERWTPLSR